MINRSKISNSYDNKKINLKKRTLSKWINDYETHAYATEDIKKEIKDLLVDVYDNNKDVRDHFIRDYVNSFSESMYERINPQDFESLFKQDADESFDIQEKNELKQYIEKRNKFLKENEKIKNNRNSYSNYWSENKTIKKNLYGFDFNDDDFENESEFRYKKIIKKRNKRNKSTEDYIDEKKRNNSKVRDYAKSRYQTLNKYNDIFSDTNDNKKSIINDYYYKAKEESINNNRENKKVLKCKKNYFLNYNHFNIKKKLIENKNKKIKLDNNKISRLLLNNKYKTKDKNEIKVYSRKDKYMNKEHKIDNSRYNLNDKEIDRNLIKQLLLNSIHNSKKKVGDCNDDDSSNSFNKYTDEYTQENGDEIKKISISGIKYKLNDEPKKEEINEEIILDKYKISNINNLNEKKEPNKESNLFHKKLIKSKYINNEDNSLVQKIKKDIKENNTRINFIQNESLKKYLLNNDNKINKSYKIRYTKENEIFGMNIFSYLDKEKRKKPRNENDYISINNYKSYNEIRKERKKKHKIFYENNKDKDKENENEKNNNKEDKEDKDNKEITKKEINNNTNNNEYNHSSYHSEINEKSINNINNNENIKEEIKINDNNFINNPTKENINGNRKKRFHRLVSSISSKL